MRYNDNSIQRLGLSSFDGERLQDEAIVRYTGVGQADVNNVNKKFSVGELRNLSVTIAETTADVGLVKRILLMDALQGVLFPANENLAKNGVFRSISSGVDDLNGVQTTARDIRTAFGKFLFNPQLVAGFDIHSTSDGIGKGSLSHFIVDELSGDRNVLVDKVDFINYIKNNTYQSKILNVDDRDYSKWIVGPKSRLILEVPQSCTVTIVFHLAKEFSGTGAIKATL